MANCKTAVSVLQELCAKKGVTPVYDTIGQEGASHQPKFTISCKAGDVLGTGQGPSKKVAKQSAAEDVLQQLDVEVPAVQTDSPDGTLKDNPVGKLQELATCLGWRKPEYLSVEESGPPHNRRFVIAVTVDKYREQGVDQSKRLAKRAAASAMLTVLESLPPDINPGLMNRKPKQKRPKQRTQSRVFLNTLPQADGTYIRSLRVNQLNRPDPTYTTMLQDLATEQNFKFEHIPLEDRNTKGHHQCFVQLLTAPVTVCFASGRNPQDAQEAASRNALQYLKVMATKTILPNASGSNSASVETNGQC